MSETLLYYLANTLLRGGIIVSLLLLLELCWRRKLVFAGGRWIFVLALLLVLLPLERIELPRGESRVSAPAYRIEVPDWNVAWEPVPAPAPTSTPTPAPVLAPAQAPVSPAAAPVPAGTAWKWTLFDLLAILYGMSVLFLSAKQIRHYFIWRNRIRRCIAITGGRVFDVFLESKRLTGLERSRVRLLDGGSLLPVAACFGTLRGGAVICPLGECGKYSDSELRMILIHELEHLRRRDNPVAFSLMVLGNLFFLNPFVRILTARWAVIAELDCDERVKRALRLDRQGMAQYAGLLLASQTGRRVPVPGCGLGASAANLKLRIQEFVMNRTKLQLLRYFTGIGLLFLLGSLFIPSLMANTREPVDPFVAANLPAGTWDLVYFNGTALDQNGAALLEKAVLVTGNVDRTLWRMLQLMLASGKNKGHFYAAVVRSYGVVILLKNGANPDEIVIAPGLSDQGATIRKLENGYFLMLPPGMALPPMGLPEELARKIAAAPDEVLRVCKKGIAGQVSVVNRDGVYTLSAIVPGGENKKGLTLETVADQAVSFVPEGRKEAQKAFVRENLKIASKTLDGKSAYEVEFQVTDQTLPLWSDYLRKIKEDREKEDEPHVVALSPANGATDVDPDTKEIVVTFDRTMSGTSWSFCQKSDIDFPEFVTRPSFDKTKTVITVPVRLAPGKTYNIYLNSPPYIGFRSAKGGVLQSVHYTFTTAGK